MTDRDGNLAQHYGYSPYGKEQYVNPDPEALEVSNRYTGQVLDEETGLYYYGSRYYDPQLARFIQADSVIPGSGNSQLLNRYSYVANNPLNFNDPTGHFLQFLVPLIIPALIGAGVSVAIAAITGGDIGKAAITGAIAGACGGWSWGIKNTVGAAMVGAAAGGALGALATGQDPVRAALTSAITAGIITTAIEACSKLSPAPTAGGPANGVEQQHFTEVATCKSGPGVGGINAGDDDLKLAYANFGEKVEISNTSMDFTDLAKVAEAWLENKPVEFKMVGGVNVMVIDGVGQLNDANLDKILRPDIERINKWWRFPTPGQLHRLKGHEGDSAFFLSSVRHWNYQGINYHTTEVNYIFQGHAHHHIFYFDWLSKKAVNHWKQDQYENSPTTGTMFWRQRGFDGYGRREKW